MSIPSIIEIWDSLLFQMYNGILFFLSLFWNLCNHRIIHKNKSLKKHYEGKRCFVIVNGPSLNNYDLAFVKDEVVFCVNYFYRSSLVNVVKPNFYCMADSSIFKEKNGTTIIDEIREKCQGVKFILNYKGRKVIGDTEDIYYVHNRHIPNCFSQKNNMAGTFSNYSTVAYLAIASAVYMGFRDIYLLGLDFEPGGFRHFETLGQTRKGQYISATKEAIGGKYWGYLKAQFESFYVRKLADRNNSHIINLNPNSWIRAFEFGDYNDIK